MQPTITSITLAELSVGPLVTDEPAERATRQARLQEAENAFDLPLFTCNTRDFAVSDALTVVSVPPPDGVSS